MSILLVSIPDEFLTDNRRELLKRLSGDHEVLITQDRSKMESVLDRIEIALGDVPRDLVTKAPNLHWYQQFGTGTEWLWKHPDAVDRPFILTNCSDDYGVVLAEHIMALILACARQLTVHFEAQQRNAWERADFNDQRRFELSDKTLLLLGVGSIGKAVAQRAKGFDMRIIGFRSDPSKTVEGIETMYGMDQLHEALSTADLVVNSLPQTPGTLKLIDAAAIDAMKPSAYFFNIGRGTTVDENALVAALRDKRIAGAGLDVTEIEPLDESSPLWDLPNVIITPHEGGNHGNRMESWVRTIFDNLQRFSEGRELRNLVDKSRSY